MSVSRIVSTLVYIAGTTAALGGCAPSVTPTDSLIPWAPSAAQRLARNASWMSKNAASQDLLYASNGDGIVNVYSYSQRNLLGELTDFTYPQGECADAKGDVYITDRGAGSIVEYAHGATKPLRTIDNSGGSPYACAISKSGDLAVANNGEGTRSGQGSVAVYAHATGTPKTYSNAKLEYVKGVAYDRYGDLLATGFSYYSDYTETYFAYLPVKSKNFALVDLPPPGSGWFQVEVNGLAWDGEYWIVQIYSDVYQYSINIKPELIGGVKLSGADLPIAFYNTNPDKQATQAVGGYGAEKITGVLFWKYPAGGEAYATVTHGVDDPVGVAVSLAK